MNIITTESTIKLKQLLVGLDKGMTLARTSADSNGVPEGKLIIGADEYEALYQAAYQAKLWMQRLADMQPKSECPLCDQNLNHFWSTCRLGKGMGEGNVRPGNC
jgi:hypothetical protein